MVKLYESFYEIVGNKKSYFRCGTIEGARSKKEKIDKRIIHRLLNLKTKIIYVDKVLEWLDVE